MSLSNLVKITKTRKRRLGQGHGSGRVKTSGRGQKGQKARGKIPATKYSGGSLAFVKRLPFLRGKGKNDTFKNVPTIFSLDILNKFKAGSVVDEKAFVAQKLISEKEAKRDGIKILGNGEVTVALTVKVSVSKSAQQKIEKAGGTVSL